MGKIETATQWMIDLANDDSHGYDQDSRWGPDYDCSSSVISAWQYAGVPVKTKGASSTYDMKNVFLLFPPSLYSRINSDNVFSITVIPSDCAE